jgi:hypothetical protein
MNSPIQILSHHLPRQIEYSVIKDQSAYDWLTAIAGRELRDSISWKTHFDDWYRPSATVCLIRNRTNGKELI